MLEIYLVIRRRSRWLGEPLRRRMEGLLESLSRDCDRDLDRLVELKLR